MGDEKRQEFQQLKSGPGSQFKDRRPLSLRNPITGVFFSTIPPRFEQCSAYGENVSSRLTSARAAGSFCGSSAIYPSLPDCSQWLRPPRPRGSSACRRSKGKPTM